MRWAQCQCSINNFLRLKVSLGVIQSERFTKGIIGISNRMGFYQLSCTFLILFALGAGAPPKNYDSRILLTNRRTPSNGNNVPVSVATTDGIFCPSIAFCFYLPIAWYYNNLLETCCRSNRSKSELQWILGITSELAY